MRAVMVLTLVGLLGAACSAQETPSEVSVTEPTNPTTPTTSLTSAPTSVPASSATSEPVEETTSCVVLADFTDADENARWQTVNDNVMGGQSLGDKSFTDSTMVFAGEVNNDGGGFSSLRFPVAEEQLTGSNAVRIRAKPDEREYMITFDDELPKRDRRVTHRAVIPFSGTEWQTATVRFDDLFPFVFGRRVDDLPFRPDLASRIGLMISDGIDGPFRLEVDSIEVCQ